MLRLDLGYLYYAFLICIFFLLFLLNLRIKINIEILLIVFAALISISLNNIPSFFQPYQRFLAFVFIVGLIGPLIKTSQLIQFRIKLLNSLNNSILILVTISFLGITFGLPAMIGRGGYTGLFNHSMTLGPMASISMLTAIFHAHNSDKKTTSWLYIGVAILAFLTCVAAGSRAAILAGIVGGMFYYFKIYQGRISRVLKILIFITLLGILSFPLWESFTERLVGKMAYAEQQGNTMVTRSTLWSNRIEEFLSSPLIGVGFASVDPTISSKFNSADGSIEPGSSWLAVLSMLGLSGFIPLVFINVKYLRFIIKSNEEIPKLALWGSFLIFFIIHMFAEGYVLSAGSGMFFYYWLIMGNIEIIRTKKYK